MKTKRIAVPLLAASTLCLSFAARPALAQDDSGGASMDFTNSQTPTTAALTAPPAQCEEGPILQQGVKLYTAGLNLANQGDTINANQNFDNASIQFDKIVNQNADPCASDQEKAQFYLGETLYHLGYYAEALNQFGKITQAGQFHLYYNKALPWLAALSEKLPDSSGVLDDVGAYSEQDLESPDLKSVHDQLLYLVGRYYFQQARTDDAIRLFEEVPDSSPYWVKAKFFEGETYVRMSQLIPPPTPGDAAAGDAIQQQTAGDFKQAVDQFKQILRSTAGLEPDQKTADQVEFEELAYLQMARAFYSFGQYDQAIKYYDMIPQESPDWLESLFEESWAMFMQKSQSHALGNIQTLNAPYFDTEFYPESLVLKSLIYFNNCRFDGSGNSIAEFRSTYVPIETELQAVVTKYPDVSQLYDYTVKVLAGSGGLSERTQRAALAQLSDREIKKNYAFVAELDTEIALVNKSPADWKNTQAAGTILSDLYLLESTAKQQAGQMAQDRLNTLIAQIKDLQNQTTRIEIETIEAKKGNMPKDLTGNGAPPSNETAVDDEHVFWPFNGEYWKDELGYYRYHIQNQCPQAPGQTAGATATAH
jgi:tetratricopeptide (TPR) repeat protein